MASDIEWAAEAMRSAETHQHHHRHAQQENGAGKAGKNLDLPCTKGKAWVLGVSSRGGVGKRRQTNCYGVRAHVPAVGQQCHRVKPPTRDNLHHHSDGGDPHD